MSCCSALHMPFCELSPALICGVLMSSPPPPFTEHTHLLLLGPSTLSTTARATGQSQKCRRLGCRALSSGPPKPPHPHTSGAWPLCAGF